MPRPRAWSTYVRDGRAAVQMEGDARWELGRLAMGAERDGHIVVEASRPRAGEHTLATYATEIDCNYDHLRECYRIAKAWDGTAVHTAVSWSTYQRLATAANRSGLMDELVAGNHCTQTCTHPRGCPTFDDARRAMGQATTRYARTVDEDAAQAEQLLSRPEVVRRVASTESGRHAIQRATLEHQRVHREEMDSVSDRPLRRTLNQQRESICPLVGQFKTLREDTEDYYDTEVVIDAEDFQLILGHYSRIGEVLDLYRLRMTYNANQPTRRKT